MKCDEDNCSSEARYFINAKMTPMCGPCMIESLCSAPTQVISREAYEYAQGQVRRLNDWHIAV